MGYGKVFSYLDSLSNVDQAGSDHCQQSVKPDHLLNKHSVHALFV